MDITKAVNRTEDTGVVIQSAKEAQDTGVDVRETIKRLKAQAKALQAQISAGRKVTEPTQSEYKGHKVLTIPQGNGKPFTFGQSKAKAMVTYYDSIKQFANM